MVTRVTRSQIFSKVPRLLLVGYSLVTRYNQTFPSNSTKQI